MPVYANLVYKTTVSILPSQLVGLPGTIIMGNVRGQRTFDQLFTAFCNYFRNGGRWTWTGLPRTPGSGDILDGNAHTGQCAALANALRSLAIIMHPYGLNMSENLLGNASGGANSGQYDGQHNNGFVALHGNNPVLGLPANVFQAPPHIPQQLTPVTGATPRTNLYLWSNHKTVPYGGRFYDPSYGVIWPNKPAMAEYEIVGDVVRRETLAGSGRVVLTTYARAVHRNGGTAYFRSLLDQEVIATQCNGYQGPFAALPGMDATGMTGSMSVGMIKQLVFNK